MYKLIDGLFISSNLKLLQTGSDKRPAYKRCIAQIEQFTKLFYLAMLVSLISIVLFNLLYTGFAYFYLNLGKESYYLFPPSEFVSITLKF